MNKEDKIYQETRGGVRGGRGQFKWENVKEDKYRENYLGNSLMAPVGRWQKNRDLTWYSKESKAERDLKREEEIRRIKEAEEDALAEALGYPVKKRKPVAPIDPKDLKALLSKGNHVEEGDLVAEAEEINGIGFSGNTTHLTGNPDSTTFRAGEAIPGSEIDDSNSRQESSLDVKLNGIDKKKKKEKKDKKDKKDKRDKKDKNSKKHDNESDQEYNERSRRASRYDTESYKRDHRNSFNNESNSRNRFNGVSKENRYDNYHRSSNAQYIKSESGYYDETRSFRENRDDRYRRDCNEGSTRPSHRDGRKYSYNDKNISKRSRSPPPLNDRHYNSKR
ncbi:hypothetical protein K502DRAFT_362627 [Neoconidiobolus thromboides FSU 785]|nr:hypothetical protein K502DRAFT_362627 [Neoconidiobolus thromboides FSU 785]